MCKNKNDTVPIQIYLVIIYRFVALNWYPSFYSIYPVLIMRVGKAIVKVNVSFVTCSRPHVTDGIPMKGFQEIPFLCFPTFWFCLKMDINDALYKDMCLYNLSQYVFIIIYTECALWKVRAEAKATVDHLARKIVGSDKRNLASNITDVHTTLIIDRKLAYNVKILTRVYEAVCRQRPELWPIFGYMMLCVDRDLNWGWQLVTWSCV